jgi:hypothetical protein
MYVVFYTMGGVKFMNRVSGVGEREWLYRCQFCAPTKKASLYELEFDGLDTFCDVYLVRFFSLPFLFQLLTAQLERPTRPQCR